ncbi:Hypp952 [Branchiostoma lanceolatum]|uniref:Hypp952 protein n=1 Tax=Branchiostoma lanceolatum TaxID=7740 RepID=A0A8K0EIR6_BRALA|nr:Hypp952 [Branchiostoma lanceolatum]
MGTIVGHTGDHVHLGHGKGHAHVEGQAGQGGRFRGKLPQNRAETGGQGLHFVPKERIARPVKAGKLYQGHRLLFAVDSCGTREKGGFLATLLDPGSGGCQAGCCTVWPGEVHVQSLGD